jgi:hypothetical protein
MVKKNLEKIKAVRLRKKEEQAISKVPRITSKNVAEHREDVLKGARKYIYPLQHSKHRILVLTTSLLLAVVLVFSISSVLFLYRFETTSTFWYQVTKVIPYPLARTGSTFIAYENYLFELEHYIHYYENQQQLSFETESGKAQLASYKERALNKVINDAYIKIIADERGISVSDIEVDEQIRIARDQNRLGSSDEVFEDVLRDFWNWSVDDFRRSLRLEILEQKVIRALDPAVEEKATEALQRINNGEDFATVASEVSEDPATKEQGGEFGFVSKSNRNVPQQTVDTLFNLEEGGVSDIMITSYGGGYALSIIKHIETNNDEVSGAHIVFPLQTVDEALNDFKEQRPYRLYMNPVD